MKDKPNKGFIKEIAKNPAPAIENKKFSYNKSITKTDPVKSYSMINRAKNMRAVKPAKTNIVAEQTQALKSHKGK